MGSGLKGTGITQANDPEDRASDLNDKSPGCTRLIPKHGRHSYPNEYHAGKCLLPYALLPRIDSHSREKGWNVISVSVALHAGQIQAAATAAS
jgi:hypothetical protein